MHTETQSNLVNEEKDYLYAEPHEILFENSYTILFIICIHFVKSKIDVLKCFGRQNKQVFLATGYRLADNIGARG